MNMQQPIMGQHLIRQQDHNMVTLHKGFPKQVKQIPYTSKRTFGKENRVNSAIEKVPTIKSLQALKTFSENLSTLDTESLRDSERSIRNFQDVKKNAFEHTDLMIKTPRGMT